MSISMGSAPALPFLWVALEERPVALDDEVLVVEEDEKEEGGLMVKEMVKTSFLPSTIPKLEEEVVAEDLERRLSVL